MLGTIEQLARELAHALERHGKGARLLQTALFRADGKVLPRRGRHRPAVARAGAHPPAVHRPARVLGDEGDPGFGFDMVRLWALVDRAHDPLQTGLAQPDHAAELAHLIDRLGARFGCAASAARAAGHPYPGIRRAGCARSLAQSRRHSGNRLPSRFRTQDTSPIRPIRLFARPEPIEAIAEVPDGPPAQFKWRRVRTTCSCRRTRAHRHGMVARRAGPRAYARLFPRRKPGGRARLALSGRSLDPTAPAALVPARDVRMSNVIEFPQGKRKAAPPLPPSITAYAELAVTTNFSFLRGASHPEELVPQAEALGLAGIGIADRNRLRAWCARISARWNQKRTSSKTLRSGLNSSPAHGWSSPTARPTFSLIRRPPCLGTADAAALGRQEPRRKGRLHSVSRRSV